MKKHYTVNIVIDKDVVMDELLTSFGGAENAVIMQMENGSLVIKEVLLEESEVEASNAVSVAQAILDLHNPSTIYDSRRKEREIKILYDIMNVEVYTQMSLVFNTTNADSANANRETWALMLENPSDWSVVGLKAEFNRGSLSIGDALDTDEKITNYASACLNAVKAYGIWRMQRIQQFRADRSLIENA